ncbi:MAG: NADP-dependent phosphogluconate dehydrogenase [Actinobacteria bacterium]|nr:NADP-dependent phosphogluconate dehydrogenase [Actinomycetota bacterium]
MGRNLVLNIADKGFSVAAFNRTTAVTQEFAGTLQPGQKIQPCYSLEEFVGALTKPRAVMIMVKAGNAVDAVIEGLVPVLEPGDIIIDGGNSYFGDTDRRVKSLAERGIHFLGVGISGGEFGARYGPSMMPGGPREAYEPVRVIFEAIAAKADGQPCVTYLGPASAGHYVKMVHNGIEYGVMQLISETYALMKMALGLTNDELARVYADWDAGELNSYLVEITSKIFRRRDDSTGSYLIDVILGEAGQLGTGMWTSQSAMDLHVPVPNIDVAVAMRSLSALEEERALAARLLTSVGGVPKTASQPHIEHVRGALRAAMIITYAQGFAHLRVASKALGFNLNLEDVAGVWRGGCIIRALLLRDIKGAFERSPELPNLLLDPPLSHEVASLRPALAEVVGGATISGIPVPGFMNALAYLDAYRTEWLPSNLIQAQRDYFGAHTYRRVDRDGIFHTDWLTE